MCNSLGHWRLVCSFPVSYDWTKGFVKLLICMYVLRMPSNNTSPLGERHRRATCLYPGNIEIQSCGRVPHHLPLCTLVRIDDVSQGSECLSNRLALSDASINGSSFTNRPRNLRLTTPCTFVSSSNTGMWDEGDVWDRNRVAVACVLRPVWANWLLKPCCPWPSPVVAG